MANSVGTMSNKDRSASLSRFNVVVTAMVGFTLGAMLYFSRSYRFVASDSLSVADGTDSRFSLSRVLSGHDLRGDPLLETVNALTKENLQLKLRQIELKRFAQQLQARNRKIDVSDHHPVKAGPVGSMKSRRKNTLVQPDESVNPELAKVLKLVVINDELVVGISDKNVLQWLRFWFDGLICIQLEIRCVNTALVNRQPTTFRSPGN